MQKGLPCPDCDSSDALAEYSDGHTYCFSCKKVTSGSPSGDARRAPRSTPSSEEVDAAWKTARVKQIKSRGLTGATCAAWNYAGRVNPRSGVEEHLALVKDEHGTPIAIHVRRCTDPKDFYWIGDGNAGANTLWGRHRFSGGGLKLLIVEGELDCLSVSQCYGEKNYAVVSVLGGAGGALKAVKHNLEWVSSFKEVIFGFDMDKPGRDACQACAAILPPGKAKIVKWSRKDANEMLLAGEVEGILRAIWTAEPYRPDGVVDARDLTERCLIPPTTGLPWFVRTLTKFTYGRRYGEEYTWGAGTGVGKTDIENEQIASDIQGRTRDGQEYEPQAVAVFTYEGGGPVLTKKAIAGKLWSRRFHLPNDTADWTEDELRAALKYMDEECWGRGGKLFINDAKGASDWDSVKDRARYLRHAEGVRHFWVDPLSALTAGHDDERKEIDRIVLEGAHLAAELESCVYLLSHLSRPKEGPSHEEGGHVRLSQFRGSNAIGMYSDFVFGVERDQQGPESQVATIRVVKDRYSGQSTGKTFKLVYDVLGGVYDEPVTNDAFMQPNPPPLEDA